MQMGGNMSWIARILFIGMSVAAMWLVFGCQAIPLTKEVTVVIQNGPEIPLYLEIADTDQKRERGLMYRETLDGNKGMIFTGDTPKVWNMWMKDTYVSLDMIFYDENGVIVKIAKNAEPESLKTISSDVPALGVIEVRGGLTDQLGIVKGDKIKGL